MTKVAKKDFIEIKFTGYANGEIFDSNIQEDLKKLDPKAKENKTIVAVGEGMVVQGLDKALEGKEINSDNEIKIPPKEGFGERKRELIRTIPLVAFTSQKINPQPGMVLSLDHNLVKIIAVSGARVTADFNNPLAGKELVYKFKIVRKVEDTKEKSEALFSAFFRFVPEFEVAENKVTIKGPKEMNILIEIYKEKFKDLTGKELSFEEKKEEKTKENKQKEKSEHDHTHDHEHPHVH